MHLLLELVMFAIFFGILYLAWEGAKSVFPRFIIHLTIRSQDLEKKRVPTDLQQVTLVFSIVEHEKGTQAIVPKRINSPWAARVIWVYTPGNGENALELPRLVLTPTQPQ